MSRIQFRHVAVLACLATVAGCASEPAGWTAALNDAPPPPQQVAHRLDALCAQVNAELGLSFNGMYNGSWESRIATIELVIHREQQFGAALRQAAGDDTVGTAMATLIDTDLVDMDVILAAGKKHDDAKIQQAWSTEYSHYGRFWYLADTHGMPRCAEGAFPARTSAVHAVELGAQYFGWWCWSDRAGGLPDDARTQAVRRIKEALAVAARSPAARYSTPSKGDATTFGGQADQITSSIDSCAKATLATAADRAALLTLHP